MYENIVKSKTINCLYAVKFYLNKHFKIRIKKFFMTFIYFYRIQFYVTKIVVNTVLLLSQNFLNI